MLSAVLKTRYNIRLMFNFKNKNSILLSARVEKIGPKSKQTKNGGLFVFFKKIDVNFDPLFFLFPLVIKFFTF
jgi:hypothetical protein